jgi:hypothetical protein
MGAGHVITHLFTKYTLFSNWKFNHAPDHQCRCKTRIPFVLASDTGLRTHFNQRRHPSRVNHCICKNVSL